MDEEQATFKVTDRRLFNADGSPRDLSPEEKTETAARPEPIDPPGNTQAEPATEPPSQPVAAEPAPIPRAVTDEGVIAGEEEFTEADIPDAHDPAGFVNFAMSIASNAASALGMMEHPVTHKREVDLELGKHWIDVLGMLQKKTAGNLSPPEAQILESWLADLRMQYVSLSGPGAAKTAYTGRDIIGGK
ncbi:MAG: hypothetical protein JWM21_3642 [Acidobacteria bacterium]|nr:hypothetical protein [Acidobacteriota bacterium]